MSGGAAHGPPIETCLTSRNRHIHPFRALADQREFGNGILSEIADPNANMDVMKLEKVPKIAVYTPKGKQPWDDAVTMVLAYAEIPYTQLYDDEVLRGDLPKYDWLHLHHEDFTGEYGKFYATYRNYPWYQQQVRDAEAAAKRNGFTKVSQMKGTVATDRKSVV